MSRPDNVPLWKVLLALLIVGHRSTLTPLPDACLGFLKPIRTGLRLIPSLAALQTMPAILMPVPDFLEGQLACPFGIRRFRR